MTLRDTINSMAGLLYALRHGNLEGMSNRQRRNEMRQLGFGIGLLTLAGIERSMGAASAACATILRPVKKLAKAGKKTQLQRTHQDWGYLVAGRLAVACLTAMMSWGAMYAPAAKTNINDKSHTQISQTDIHMPKPPVIRV